MPSDDRLLTLALEVAELREELDSANAAIRRIYLDDNEVSIMGCNTFNEWLRLPAVQKAHEPNGSGSRIKKVFDYERRENENQRNGMDLDRSPCQRGRGR